MGKELPCCGWFCCIHINNWSSGLVLLYAGMIYLILEKE